MSSLHNIIEREVRGLSLKQPFASLMLLGKVETRTFKTSYRGLVMICASKERYGDAHLRNWCGQELMSEIALHCPEQPQGVAIAIGELVDCRPIRPEDAHFINYHRGWGHMYGWHFENMMAIQPFPHKGQQGMPRLSQETKNKIRHLY
jgi:hypothetical protein